MYEGKSSVWHCSEDRIKHGGYVFGGTSVAAPIIGSVYALAGNAGGATPAIQYGEYPYSHRAGLNDITSGSNGRCTTNKRNTSNREHNNKLMYRKILKLLQRNKWRLVPGGMILLTVLIVTDIALSVYLEVGRPDRSPDKVAAAIKPRHSDASDRKITPDYTIPPVTDGLVPVLDSIPTKQPVVFLGIDDGANKQPFQLRLMQAKHIRASLFLSELFIKDNPVYFKSFVAAGSVIENHTVNHELLSSLSYGQQKQEICDEADILEQEFGRRPLLFRPPGGEYNIDTRRAAADCGMQALILWSAKANGGSMQYQSGDSLRPGDIVLMHFRPEFREDMQAFIDAQKAAGLRVELLEDWLTPP